MSVRRESVLPGLAFASSSIEHLLAWLVSWRKAKSCCSRSDGDALARRRGGRLQLQCNHDFTNQMYA